MMLMGYDGKLNMLAEADTKLVQTFIHVMGYLVVYSTFLCIEVLLAQRHGRIHSSPRGQAPVCADSAAFGTEAWRVCCSRKGVA